MREARIGWGRFEAGLVGGAGALGFWDAGRLVVLTNGFAKKSQKTPAREIELAEQRKRDYLNRKLKQ